MKKVFRINPLIYTAILLLVGCTKEKTSDEIEYKVTNWPVLKTLKATNIDSTTAKLNGTINGHGLSTTVTFEYGTTTTYGSTVTAFQSPVTGDSITHVSAEISGLTPCTIYHFRVKAENSKWINFYGADSTFISGHIPTLTTTLISGLTSTTAVSGGNISYSVCPITERGIYWWSSNIQADHFYLKNDSTGTGSFISNLTGLDSTTTYYVQSSAINCAGTALGNIISFTTLPTAKTLEATNISSTGGTLNGNVYANNLTTTVTFEYGTTTSYGNSEIASQSPVTGNTITNVSADISGLEGGTTYHFRIKTENSLGVVYGRDMELFTIKVPTATTLAATNISASTATLNGIVNPNNLSTTITFEYGITTSYGSTATASQSPITGNTVTDVSSDISELTIGTTYHFRVKTINSLGTSYGDDMSFVTLGQAPTCSTQPATNISETGATLNGTVNVNELSTIVTFEYGITTSYGSIATASQSPVTGNSVTNVSADIYELTRGTTYHFRVKTVNSLGTSYGDDMSFVTLGQAPTCTTQRATNIFATGVTLNGTVNANDLSTTVTFEYGTTTSYGITATASQSPVTGNTNINVSSDISGLTGGITYHFRIKVENSLGVTYGSDMEFFTIQVPTVTKPKVAYLTSTTATLYSTVNANNFSSIVIFEYGTTTNYGQEVTPAQSPVIGNTYTDVVVTLTGLTCGATYHFRVKAENSIGTSYSDDITFSLAQKPTLITYSVSGITDSTAVSGGHIISDGCAAVTARGVQWSLSSTFFCWLPPCKFSHTNDGAGTGSFTSNLKGLRPNITYYVRAFATNSAGTTYGNVISFTTLP
jgi:hypothetical protein